MKVVFNINMQKHEANVSPASVRDMKRFSRVEQADLWKDILADAERCYNDAIENLFTKP